MSTKAVTSCMQRCVVGSVSLDISEARDKVPCGGFVISLKMTGQEPHGLLIKVLVVD